MMQEGGAESPSQMDCVGHYKPQGSECLAHIRTARWPGLGSGGRSGDRLWSSMHPSVPVDRFGRQIERASVGRGRRPGPTATAWQWCECEAPLG